MALVTPSRRYEVYVQNFPGGWRQAAGLHRRGNSPRWRRDRRESFYYGTEKLMAAPVSSGEIVETDAAVALFKFRSGTSPGFAPYATTADGQRFLIDAVMETEPNAPLRVVVNWAAGIKQ